ncbi:hypothetical protein [Enterococcus malodoratus]|uniref:hypothetical protein n=1 Tax=Enterococcus malodoratus TaxID=71451 RepID=UPI0039AFAB36
MGLYFADSTSIQTTILLLIFVILLGVIVWKRTNIRYWGRLTIGMFTLGLYICILGATRDGLHLTVQHAIDGSVAPGLFSLISLQTVVGTVLGVVIVLSAMLSIFFKEQRRREQLFFIIAGSVLLKILTIEVSRIILVLS